jgi:hypothetical protein
MAVKRYDYPQRPLHAYALAAWDVAREAERGVALWCTAAYRTGGWDWMRDSALSRNAVLTHVAAQLEASQAMREAAQYEPEGSA